MCSKKHLSECLKIQCCCPSLLMKLSSFFFVRLSSRSFSERENYIFLILIENVKIPRNMGGGTYVGSSAEDVASTAGKMSETWQFLLTVVYWFYAVRSWRTNRKSSGKSGRSSGENCFFAAAQSTYGWWSSSLTFNETLLVLLKTSVLKKSSASNGYIITFCGQLWAWKSSRSLV